jgi:hypothetical protein
MRPGADEIKAANLSIPVVDPEIGALEQSRFKRKGGAETRV